ncbi:restriction endonuclease subunit S [Mailhella massiliensis]|uniref:restriction endonuclease subunit S n=2 Tax=Bacteria TaxID=2 RepID=UPI001EF45B51|nr:restriction endonuclease subunit S [Mailhella massiliensis]
MCGGTPSSKHPEFFAGSIPWIGTTALNGGKLDKADAVKLITREAVEKSATKIIPPNSIMVGIRVGVGKVAINSVPMCTSQDIVSVVSIDEAEWCKEYISMVLQYKAPVLAAQAQGATITGISSKTLKSITIPVAPLETQRRIVEELRAIEAQKVAANSILKSFSALVKSRFVEMFGDPSDNSRNYQVVSIGEILSVQPSNGLYKPQKDYVTDGSGVPIIRIDSFNEEGPNYSALKRLNCTQKETEKYGLRDGDIVVNRVNSIGCMGKTMLIDHLPEVVVFESNMMRMHVEESTMFPRFLRHQMTSDYAKRYFESHAKKAIGQASINQADVKGLKVLVPPYVDQKSFLDFAAEVDKSRVVVQKQIEKLQTLYDSLAQEYFG